jgi:hypothetical protein
MSLSFTPEAFLQVFAAYNQWAWMGLVYHIGFFRFINPAALGFGIAFLVQAWLFLVWGVNTRGRVAVA